MISEIYIWIRKSSNKLFQSKYIYPNIYVVQINTFPTLNLYGPITQGKKQYNKANVFQGGEVQITLAARLRREQYMAFGISGAEGRPAMLGADVVVAYWDNR